MHRQDRNQEESFPPPPHPPSAQRQSCHDAARNEAETATVKSASDDKQDDIAVRSVLEMGYPKSTINYAVERLRKQGMVMRPAASPMPT